MNLYLTLKFIHIISSVVLVGTGFGSAYYMYFANRSQCLNTQHHVAKLVVRADWWFTTPTIIIQPVTGLWMAHLAGWPIDTPWLAASIFLYLLAGACWLPVVWLQMRMLELAKTSTLQHTELPEIYWRYARWWEGLGYPAFFAMVLVFYLMVAKPDLLF